MSLILEGPDNAGKTTLCKDVQKLCPDVQAWHAGGRPDDDKIGELLNNQLNLSTRSDLIMDRVTAISEQVYRPGMIDHEAYLYWLKWATSSAKCVVVYCKPPIDNLLNRESISFRDEEDEETRHRILDELHLYVERYERVMSKIPHLTYDYTDELGAGWLRKYIVEAFNSKNFSKLKELTTAGVL